MIRKSQVQPSSPQSPASAELIWDHKRRTWVVGEKYRLQLLAASNCVYNLLGSVWNAQWRKLPLSTAFSIPKLLNPPYYETAQDCTSNTLPACASRRSRRSLDGNDGQDRTVISAGPFHVNQPELDESPTVTTEVEEVTRQAVSACQVVGCLLGAFRCGWSPAEQIEPAFSSKKYKACRQYPVDFFTKHALLLLEILAGGQTVEAERELVVLKTITPSYWRGVLLVRTCL